MIQQPKQHKKSTVIPFFLIASTAVTAVAVLFILSFVVINGIGKINLRFLFTAPRGFDVNEGGIFPAIISTVYLGAVAGIAGLVCALPVSIFLCFFVKNAQLRAAIRLMLYALAAVPSIILGLFGYTVFVKYLHFGKSLIAGGLTLGIMIFPFLEQRIEKALTELDELLLLSACSCPLHWFCDRGNRSDHPYRSSTHRSGTNAADGPCNGITLSSLFAGKRRH